MIEAKQYILFQETHIQLSILGDTVYSVKLPDYLEIFKCLPTSTTLWLVMINCHVGYTHREHISMSLSGTGASRPYRHSNMHIHYPLINELSDIKYAPEDLRT